MKYLTIALCSFCLFTLPTATDAQPAQQAANQNSRFVMTLNDSLVSNLKSLGTLSSNLPEQAVGKIAAVHLQFSGPSTQPASSVEAPVSVANDVCRIELNDELLDMARQNTIRVDLPEGSSFASVFLDYDRADADVAPMNLQSDQDSSSSIASAPVTLQHFVKLTGQTQPISGVLELADSIKFDTKFGEVDIALAQITGIRFHIDGDDSAVVVLNNGDSITGVTKSDSFILNTDWGRAEFDPIFVEAITTSPNARFEQSSDPSFGARWQLKNR